MKILYTCQDITAAGGLERILCEKASAMAARGHEVWLLVCNPPGASPAYPLDGRVRLVDVALPQPRGLLQRLRFKLRQSARIMRAVRSVRPDITVAVPTWLSWAMLLAPGRLVLESHNSRRHMFDSERHSLYKRLKVAMAERVAACVVALTEEDAANWPAARRAEVIDNFTQMQPPQEPPARTKRFMAAGRMHPQKGFDMLVDAWAEVVRRHPEASIDIYGTGELLPELRAQAGRLGLGSSVCFAGAAADMAAAYASHQALVLSSRYEGFGLVIIEAMRCGCVPVAFDCPCGPREIVRNGESGIVVPFRGLSRGQRVAGLADAVCRLIERPAECREMADNALAGSARFGREAVMARWEALFGELAGR